MNDSATTHSLLPPWPRAIAAVTLFVQDLERAKEFYHSTFGLPIDFQDKNSAVFRFGNTLVNLLLVGAAVELIAPVPVPDRTAGSGMVLTVLVDDVDALCSKLTARGVKLLNGPMNRPWGPRTASFCDPDGHIWEIAK
jgi:catechol 2,3-dioxygenase-like lactoylglutathione lyase family enzyme